MKKLLFFPFILIFIVRCAENNGTNSNSGKISLDITTDSISFTLGKNEVSHTLRNQYFTDSDTDYLAILNDNRKTICIYNLYKQKLSKEIIFEKEGENAFPGLSSFIIKNKDTILLISAMPRCVGIYNWKSKKIKKIYYDKDESGKILQPSSAHLGRKGILKDSFLNIIQNYRIDEPSGILTNIKQQDFNLIISINLNNGKIVSLPLKYPTELIGKDLFNTNLSWEYGHNNNFVFLFSLLDEIYFSNDIEVLKKTKIESNYSLDLASNMSKYSSDFEGLINYSLKKDHLRAILYDRYREIYFIVVRKRTDKINKSENSQIKFLYPNCYFIIVDKEFKYLGDYHFPDNTYSFNNMFITEKGIYISEDHVNNPTYSDDAMRFRLFKVNKN